MDELNAAVVEHLKAQRDHEDVVALWEKLWMRFRRDGADGVEELLQELLEVPDTNKAGKGR
ncbi:hypothetical protein [Polyangium aurulentum]|uniref:hypothetical protein n=1 Tax=Polyangium aurulentum TaxID=2567896 RepID=UPI0010AE64FC|nr:hypothetical protein [Polyangium aurulentum]UQA61392.1 hypothetical protein E8A73_013320 [Polyangium aurulentum]